MRKVALYGLMSTVVLFLGFFTNFWHVADEQWFQASFRYNLDSLVAGRMVKSRQDGIFSAGGLLGHGSPDANPDRWEWGDASFAFQHRAYMDGLAFASFWTYKSQVGAQGMLFSALDGLMRFAPHTKLQVFYAFSSLLSALTLTMIVVWFRGEFGLWVSLVVLVSSVLSPWLVVFGGPLFLPLWPLYVPMAVVMQYLRGRNLASRQLAALAALAFLAVLVKCLFTGYEYITTVLLMMIVPLVYRCMVRGLSWRRFVGASVVVGLSSSLAILLSMVILCVQIGSVQGGILKGVEHIAHSFEKRTFATPDSTSPEYALYLRTPTAFAVLATYLVEGSFVGGVNPASPYLLRLLWHVKYLYLVLLFAVASIFVYLWRNRYRDKERQRRALALVSTTWVSLLAPLSWFTIFREHSSVQTDMNYILWHLPFALFGFAVCGVALQTVVTSRRGPVHAA